PRGDRRDGEADRRARRLGHHPGAGHAPGRPGQGADAAAAPPAGRPEGRGVTPPAQAMTAPHPAAARKNPGLFASMLILMRKDLLIEWRTRARMTALIFF